ncbi:hypothetical protein MNBD_GAMMA08-1379 [hydrothermal vent metagenome]|uniref:Uncharacterized protein n=1 Tax=hydrothermal vent metagenome TaxID=652676 RepID=A0A3B0X9S5_9ZZZZ
MREKRKNFKMGFLFTLLILTITSQATASTSSKQKIGANYFKIGTSYFKSENYESAAKSFERARKQGIRSTALYYNLGSTYYKLEDYTKAKKYFSELKKVKKMRSLAEYNLGLIAVKQKDTNKAKKYFTSIIKTSNDSKLIHLAKKQLNNTKSSRKKPAKKKWSVYLNGSFGNDSNINFAPAGIRTEESATFFDAMASANYLFKGTRKNGWTADAIFYTIRYADTGNPNINQGAFDQDQLGASLKKTQKIKTWDTHLKLSFDKYTFGPRDYQSILKLETKGKKKLSKTDRFYLRYRYEDISSDDATFDYIEGWRQKIRGEFRRYNKNNSAQFYYELELNDRNDFVSNTTGNEFSYSPTRHTLRGKYMTKLNSAWRLTGDLAYRKSDYPATATQNRNDDRWKASVYTDYRFDKTMKVKFKFEYTDNTSSDNLYVYDRQVISASLSKLF